MKKTIIVLGLALTPGFVLAATGVNNLHDLIVQIQGLINDLVPLLFGVALIGFMTGVIKYMWAGGNAQKIGEARNYMVFSIVALAVMLSVWSLAFFLKNSFFPNAPTTLGGIPTGGSLGSGTGTGVGPGSGTGTGHGTGTGTGTGTGPNPGINNGTGGCAPSDNGAYCSGSSGFGKCQGGQCVYGLPAASVANGASCNEDAECKSGYCASEDSPAVCTDDPNASSGTGSSGNGNGLGSACTPGEGCVTADGQDGSCDDSGQCI